MQRGWPQPGHPLFYIMKKLLIFLSITLLISCSNQSEQQATITDNQSVEAQLNAWNAQHFGMFVHFGVYSELGGIWKGQQIPFYAEQIMNHARIPVSEYEEVARHFQPKDWDANQVVSLAKEAGMKYIVITTKHHDGFCMFKTNTTPYNIVDFGGFGRDVVGELAAECHRQGIGLGFYFSLPDWHDSRSIPRLEPDTLTDCTEWVNQVYSPLELITPAMEDVIVEQLTELLTNYGDVETIWFDMGLPTPEQSQRFRNTVKSLQPNCLISGRIMNGQGDYLTLPDNGDVVGYADVYWDNPASLYGSWGYKSWITRPDVDVQVERQLNRLFSTVSHGGVFLLNIGPKGDGTILDYEVEVLTKMGHYLQANPDTLDHLVVTPPVAPMIQAVDGQFALDDANGLRHAAFAAENYLSTQADSWRSWNLDVSEDGDYDIFIEYLPLEAAKRYVIECDGNRIEHLFPGVDDMLQTTYAGTLHLTKGQRELSLKQADLHDPLSPLSLQLQRIVIRKAKSLAR